MRTKDKRAERINHLRAEHDEIEAKREELEDAMRLLAGDPDTVDDQLEMIKGDPRRAPSRQPSKRSIITRHHDAVEDLLEKLLVMAWAIATDNRKRCRCVEGGPRCLHDATKWHNELQAEALERCDEARAVGLVLVHDDDVGAA